MISRVTFSLFSTAAKSACLKPHGREKVIINVNHSLKFLYYCFFLLLRDGFSLNQLKNHTGKHFVIGFFFFLFNDIFQGEEKKEKGSKQNERNASQKSKTKTRGEWFGEVCVVFIALL